MHYSCLNHFFSAKRKKMFDNCEKRKEKTNFNFLSSLPVPLADSSYGFLPLNKAVECNKQKLRCFSPIYVIIGNYLKLLLVF